VVAESPKFRLVGDCSADAVTVAATEAGLEVNLDTPLPSRLPVDCATAIFCLGTCFHRRSAIERLEIVVDGTCHGPTAFRMPRLDLFRELHPFLSIEEDGSVDRDSSSTEDPEVRCYRSGFWATIPIEARALPGEIELGVRVRMADGRMASAGLGRIEVVEPSNPPSYGDAADRRGGDLIAICMATFNPDPELFRGQIDSLRGQTDTDWICLISDDCSAPAHFEAIERTVGRDSRFVVSRSDRNLGFYRNFERALGMVPAETALVALCDQDDRWYPDKLEVLRRSIGSAQLTYSDTRLVDADGRVLADSLWKRRRNNQTNFASMLIANTISGAASLLRREVVDLALPFPEAPGHLFHDHWLGLIAMATGEVSYVDRPLYDYVQHSGAVQGKMVVEDDASPAQSGGWARRRLRALREFFIGWRSAYFLGYVTLKVQVEVLRLRCSSRLTPRKRRVLTRILASERSPLSFAWLSARPLRGLFGRSETLGAEEDLAKGILWRHIVALRTRRRETPQGSLHDSSLPLAASFDQKRLRRWRALR
jgi:glycosyltransferase involved in cell wall biosynthesis